MVGGENFEGDEQMKKKEEFHGAFLRKKHQWRRGVWEKKEGVFCYFC